METGDFVKPIEAPPAWSELLLVKQSKLSHERMNVSSRLLLQCLLVRNLKDFQQEFPDRMFDVGIAEQHAATMAAGIGNTRNEAVSCDLFNVFTKSI